LLVKMVGAITSRSEGYGLLSRRENDSTLNYSIGVVQEEDPKIKDKLVDLERLMRELNTIIHEYDGPVEGHQLMHNSDFVETNEGILGLLKEVDGALNIHDYLGMYEQIIQKALKTQEAFSKRGKSSGYYHPRPVGRTRYNKGALSENFRRSEC